jgi:hypothetical protein
VFRQSTSPYFKWAAHDDVLMPTFIEQCVQILDRNEDIVNCAPDALPVDEDCSPLQYSGRDKAMVDTYADLRFVNDENNENLASTDVVERFAAAVLHTHLCVEMYGVIRKTALERTSIMPNYVGADKVILVQLSLLGRYYLLHEPLLHRRCHIYQASSRNPEIFTPSWVAGKAKRSIPHYLKMAAAYIEAVAAAELTPGQRARCLGIIGRRAIARTLYGANRQ